MDDFYNIPVNSESKHGLGLSPSELDTLQFPTLFEELDNEHLLALDEPQSFYLAYPDAGVFGTSEEVISRATTAETPQSECSTRTTLSTSNISPSSDFLSYPDRPTSLEAETMYYDTVQHSAPARQSRAPSATWPGTGLTSVGLNHASTSPSRPVLHRPQSFSNRTHQFTLTEDHTPPPPSSFYPSPSLQPQLMSSISPYVAPNVHSPHMPQFSQLPAQNTFLQAAVPGNASPYYLQAGLQQRLSQQQIQQQFQQRLQFQLQQQQSLDQQQALHDQHQIHTHQTTTLYPQHVQLNAHAPMLPTYNTPSIGSTNGTTISTAPSMANTPNSLPNTTGNSSTGYQCFSHGCGGRHFSNWGNLVRHHRERQLRSKAGAKPTCPRCSKGFTRSSARDAHVAGLKCVLGRRRRGAGPTANTNAHGTGTDTSETTAALNATKGASGVRPEQERADSAERGFGRDRDGGEPIVEFPINEHEHEDGLDGSHHNGNKDERRDDAAADDDDDEDDFMHDRRMNLLETRKVEYLTVDDHEGGVLANALGVGIDNTGSGSTRPAYLIPQQLQFQH